MEDNIEYRLWDSQWVNIVNHDYSDMSKADAVNRAVKLVEHAMRDNAVRNNWPRQK